VGVWLQVRWPAVWLLAPPWLRLRRDLLALLYPRLTIALYKAPFPHWTGIWEAYALPFASDPFVGKALAPWLVESERGMRHSRPLPLSILLGARPLSANPALALLGGVASRLLAQPALRAEPVFLT
jgi:hypothetical protein